MKHSEIRIPLTEIRVKYRSSTQRPITEMDRLVMQAIAGGASSVDSLKPIFQLPERLLVECLVDLMDNALLALDMSGSGFRLTAFGEKIIREGLAFFGERLDDAGEMTFLREDVAGRIAPGQLIWYDRAKGDVQSADGLWNIPYGDIEQALIRVLKKQDKHLHSVESIVPVRDSISFRVTVGDRGISGLPNCWGHLAPIIKVEAEKRTGVSHDAQQRQSEVGQDDDFWVEINVDLSDVLLKASDHVDVLANAIEQADSHLLILSAHASETVLNNLKEPVRAAIRRGVRVDCLWGLPSLNEGGESHARTTKKWLQEIRRLSDGAGDRLTVNEEPLNSDAKVLVWDSPDGSYHAIVGSYNWLYGLDEPAAERRGSEVGIRLNDPRLVGNICTTLAGWLDSGGQQLNGVALRWRNIGRRLAQTECPPASGDARASARVRLIYDESHAEVLREGLVNASQRLLVVSHKINRSATGNPNSGGGKLDWLARRTADSEFSFVLVTGRNPKEDSWTPEDQRRLEALVQRVEGSARLGKGTHSRALVYDDTAVVTSYSFLSATRDKRHVGVMLRGPIVANALWDAFQAMES